MRKPFGIVVVRKNKKKAASDKDGSSGVDSGAGGRSFELENAKKCRIELYEKGIDDTHRQWLARLVATRRIVIVPTANALGYYRNQRTEESIDPNRDFPYDLTDSTKCKLVSVEYVCHFQNNCRGLTDLPAICDAILLKL